MTIRYRALPSFRQGSFILKDGVLSSTIEGRGQARIGGMK
jgi:hypothetical protein